MILTQSQNLGILMTALTLKVLKFTLMYSHQIITKPIHHLNNSSFCIDLIFTTQWNLAMESGFHSSLHADCHHQLPYVKFNLIFFFHRLMNEKCGIINLRILIAFKGQLKILIGKRHFSLLMLIKKCE